MYTPTRMTKNGKQPTVVYFDQWIHAFAWLKTTNGSGQRDVASIEWTTKNITYPNKYVQNLILSLLYIFGQILMQIWSNFNSILVLLFWSC